MQLSEVFAPAVSVLSVSCWNSGIITYSFKFSYLRTLEATSPFHTRKKGGKNEKTTFLSSNREFRSKDKKICLLNWRDRQADTEITTYQSRNIGAEISLGVSARQENFDCNWLLDAQCVGSTESEKNKTSWRIQSLGGQQFFEFYTYKLDPSSHNEYQRKIHSCFQQRRGKVNKHFEKHQSSLFLSRLSLRRNYLTKA